jgi:hypothetical protein
MESKQTSGILKQKRYDSPDSKVLGEVSLVSSPSERQTPLSHWSPSSPGIVDRKLVSSIRRIKSNK